MKSLDLETLRMTFENDINMLKLIWDFSDWGRIYFKEWNYNGDWSITVIATNSSIIPNNDNQLRIRHSMVINSDLSSFNPCYLNKASINVARCNWKSFHGWLRKRLHQQNVCLLPSEVLFAHILHIQWWKSSTRYRKRWKGQWLCLHH